MPPGHLPCPSKGTPLSQQTKLYPHFRGHCCSHLLRCNTPPLPCTSCLLPGLMTVLLRVRPGSDVIDCVSDAFSRFGVCCPPVPVGSNRPDNRRVPHSGKREVSQSVVVGTLTLSSASPKSYCCLIPAIGIRPGRQRATESDRAPNTL